MESALGWPENKDQWEKAMTRMRRERDSIGERDLPEEADYGIHSARAM